MTELDTSGVDEISNVMALPTDDEVPGYQVRDSAHCEESIDLINGVTNESLSFGLLQTAGWGTPSVEEGRLADAVYVVLTDEQRHRRFAKAVILSRPDVSAYFHKPGLDRSGFSLNADVGVLKGRYALGVAVADGDRLEICARPETTVNISPP